MCCGVNGSLDWGQSSPMFTVNKTPDSCCKVYEEGCGGKTTAVKYMDVSFFFLLPSRQTQKT